MVAAITPTPNHGPVGTVVTIDGTGFTPSAEVDLTFSGAALTPTPDPVTVELDGTFSCTIVVPEAVQGVHVINADDGTLNANTNFTVDPEITPTPSTSSPGEDVDVDGTGFAADSDVVIEFDGDPIATTPTTITTDSNGSFTSTITVPAVVADTYPITATDESTNTDSANLVVKTVPDAPVLTLVDANKDSLETSWTTPADGDDTIDHYTVEWSVNEDFTDSDTHNVAFGTNIYTIPSLEQGTPYFVRVFAVNSIGDSDYSNVVTGTPQIPTVTLSSIPAGTPAFHKSYFYNDGVTFPVNSDAYEDQAIIDNRDFRKLMLQMLCTHASKGLTYEVRGILHEGDNTIPPTDTAGIKKWEILFADVAVAFGASSFKKIEDEWSYILVRTKQTTSGGGNESSGELRVKELQ